MDKDRRYKTINHLITDGRLTTFIEIFDTLPKTVVAKDLKITLDRFTKKMHDVERLGIRELFRLAALIEVDEKLLFNLVYNQFHATKKPRKKK